MRCSSLRRYGQAQTPLLWTPACGTALQDALNRIIKNGADPDSPAGDGRQGRSAELERVAK